MADYDFYRNEYYGSAVPIEEWPFYSARAGEQLARYRRIYAVSVPEGQPDSEDRAVCAMAETLYGFDLLLSGEGGPVQSASVGSVSVSYGGGAAPAVDLSPKGQERELYRCACRYLDICRGGVIAHQTAERAGGLPAVQSDRHPLPLGRRLRVHPEGD